MRASQPERSFFDASVDASLDASLDEALDDDARRAQPPRMPPQPPMARWRRWLFVWLTNAQGSEAAALGLPAHRVIEVEKRIDF